MISGQIDLSAGAAGMFSGLLVAFLLQAGVPWVLAMLITIVGACVIGLFNAFLANVLNFLSFISTLGVMTIFSGSGYVLTMHRRFLTVTKLFGESDDGNFRVLPAAVVIMVFVYAIYGFILYGTDSAVGCICAAATGMRRALPVSIPKKSQPSCS